MKNGMRSFFITFLLVLFSLFSLTQCDLIIGGGERTGNVGIDLSGFYGEGRAIGMPPGITLTGVKVSVFGPGMARIEKTVSAGTRYINMYVPAGQERYFTLEIFFSIYSGNDFPYSHVRTFKGRTIADLRPGYFVGLKFNMAAGATSLLVPDNKQNSGNGIVYQAESITADSFPPTNFGTGGRPVFHDLEIASDGRIFSAENSNIGYGDNVDHTSLTPIPITSPTALAMDRALYYDLNASIDGVLETNVLYAAYGTSLRYIILDDTNAGPMPPSAVRSLIDPGMDTITGMAVDPWTHHLFLVGTIGTQAVLVEYDPLFPSRTPGQPVGQPIGHPSFRTLNDVIVKDDGIYVLNQVQPAETDLPIILKFDRNHNYLGGFGTVSSYFHTGQQTWLFEESVAPGKFYGPKRFFARENDGLYIIDDCSAFDKVVHISTDLSASSWQTFPAAVGGAEPFDFFD